MFSLYEKKYWNEHWTQVRDGNVTNLDNLVAFHHSPLSLDRVHPEASGIARASTIGTVAKGRSIQGLRARVQSPLHSRIAGTHSSECASAQST